jgi:ribosome modulation factor
MPNDFLDELLAGGSGYCVSFKPDGASIRPADDTDIALKAFQTIVEQVEANEGYGYNIFQTHESSDRPGNRVDLMILKFSEGGLAHSEEGRTAFQDGKDIHDCPYTYPPFRDAWTAGWHSAEESAHR